MPVDREGEELVPVEPKPADGGNQCSMQLSQVRDGVSPPRGVGDAATQAQPSCEVDSRPAIAVAAPVGPAFD